MTTKRYLGDSVYVDFDRWAVGGAIILTTENGFGASNTIVMEPEVVKAFERYLEALKTALAQKPEDS